MKQKIWASFSFFILLASFIGAYYLSSFIFGITGTPNTLVAFLIACLLGFFLLFLVMNIARPLFVKFHGKDPHENEFLSAMQAIATGNFDTLLEIGQNERYGELAAAFNDMAKKLSDTESMRQDFISNVSHEIQSPLTSISGFAALLKTDTLTTEQRTHYLNIIEAESKRLSKLSDNLLKLSALESDGAALAKSEFRLDKQIESVILMLEPQWSEKNIELDISLAKNVFTGDKELLMQVWVNLLHNAVKFTPNDGKIIVVLQENTIKIADTGIGISDEDKIHIFERFYKVDKSRDRSLGGNGLGLSLAKKIVELHSGQIDIKSELEHGTEFIITLPK